MRAPGEPCAAGRDDEHRCRDEGQAASLVGERRKCADWSRDRVEREVRAVPDEPLVARLVGADPEERVLLEERHPIGGGRAVVPGADVDEKPVRDAGLVRSGHADLEALLRDLVLPARGIEFLDLLARRLAAGGELLHRAERAPLRERRAERARARLLSQDQEGYQEIHEGYVQGAR